MTTPPVPRGQLSGTRRGPDLSDVAGETFILHKRQMFTAAVRLAMPASSP